MSSTTAADSSWAGADDQVNAPTRSAESSTGSDFDTRPEMVSTSSSAQPWSPRSTRRVPPTSDGFTRSIISKGRVWSLPCRRNSRPRCVSCTPIAGAVTAPASSAGSMGVYVDPPVAAEIRIRWASTAKTGLPARRIMPVRQSPGGAATGARRPSENV